MLGKSHSGLSKVPRKKERKKDRRGRLRGERDKVNLNDLSLERLQVVGFGKGDEGKTFHL